MNKHILNIIAAGTLLLAGGCSDNTRPETPGEGEREYMEIWAGIEGLTKTDISAGKTSWQAGDEITVVYDGKAYAYTASADGTETVFRSDDGLTSYDSSKSLTAYYPATDAAGTIGIDPQRTLVFSEGTQTALARAPLVGTPKEGNLSQGQLLLTFSNIFSVIELTVDAGDIASEAKTLTVEPADPADFQGSLTVSGTVDPQTLAITASTTGNVLKMTFPDGTDLRNRLTVKFPVGRFSTGSGLKLTLETADGSAYRRNIYKTGLTSYEESDGKFTVRHLGKELYAFAPEGGISSASDLVAFSAAVNAGESISEWMNAEGKVVLLNDIDMSGVSSWTPIGNASMTWASNVLSISGNSFEGWFDGQGHSIRNFAMLCDNATAGKPWGLFGVLGTGAVVENLVFDSSCSLYVKATAQTDCGILAGLMNDATVRGITNNAPLSFDGAAPDNNRMTMAIIGFANAVKGSVIDKVTNNGTITATSGGNTKAGATCVHIAGIVGFSTNDAASTSPVALTNCSNTGDITSATARTSAIAAACNRYTTITDCVNTGDIFDNFATSEGARIGGITCISGVGTKITRVVNYGDIVCDNSGALGGIVCLVNHASNVFTDVKFLGNAISDKISTGKYFGNFFGYCNFAATITGCAVGGDVGAYNKGEYQMVGLNADNYLTYIGQMGTSSTKFTAENISWQNND
ncbi:MAG: fimbrillin family protein [Candidatus Cryptobacteroides sp.]